MLISLRKQAAMNLKTSTAIKESTEAAWMAAERYRISEQTVWTEPRARHRTKRRCEAAAATTSVTRAISRTTCRRR
jgi:hypothetical protein